jgi:heme A synthase
MAGLLFWIAGICIGAGATLAKTSETDTGTGYIVLGFVLTIVAGALVAKDDGEDKCNDTSTSSKTEQ